MRAAVTVDLDKLESIRDRDIQLHNEIAMGVMKAYTPFTNKFNMPCTAVLAKQMIDEQSTLQQNKHTLGGR